MSKNYLDIKTSPCKEIKNKILITSDFGYRKFTYKGKVHEGQHRGVDISPENNKKVNIVAVEDGKVIVARDSIPGYDETNSSGNYVIIEHNSKYRSIYCHMEHKSIKVKVGDKVKKGQLLGIMGNTGFSTGRHLHFGLIENKRNYIDPKSYLKGEIEIIEEKNENTIKAGRYKTTANMYVRKDAGTIYPKKLVKDISDDGRKHATSTNPNAFAVLKKGTKYDASEIIVATNKGIWAKIPSGYICMVGSDGKKYYEEV